MSAMPEWFQAANRKETDGHDEFMRRWVAALNEYANAFYGRRVTEKKSGRRPITQDEVLDCHEQLAKVTTLEGLL